MSQSVKCEEPGCPLFIFFEYDPSTPGILRIVNNTLDVATLEEVKIEEIFQKNENKIVRAYLTCAKGHTHSYSVEISK